MKQRQLVSNFKACGKNLQLCSFNVSGNVVSANNECKL